MEHEWALKYVSMLARGLGGYTMHGHGMLALKLTRHELIQWPKHPPIINKSRWAVWQYLLVAMTAGAYRKQYSEGRVDTRNHYHDNDRSAYRYHHCRERDKNTTEHQLSISTSLTADLLARKLS